MTISIPDFCLVALVGVSGAGKSTFARKHFLPTEVISSDFCRGLVSDDENDQSASREAFDVLYYIAAKRLAARRLTVIDATNVRPEDRRRLVALAREYHALPVALVFNMPRQLCEARNATRPDRQFGGHVIRNQMSALRRSQKRIRREGFRVVYDFQSAEEVDAVELERQPLWTDKRSLEGPFDIIGDVHGCCDELEALLTQLGYRIERGAADGSTGYQVTPPEGRRALFLGDLVDRGPRVPGVLRLAMAMVADGSALAIMGNHENKLLRKLRGKNVKVSHGLAESLEQLERESDGFREEVTRFLDGLLSHYWLDGGKLTVAHAGLREDMQGRGSGAVRAFALYGETTGETDEFGLPVRYNWAAEYRGRSKVVYGHTPVPEAEWLNGTICLDTGCVFGGKLTALRYPELELVSVPAAKVYCEPVRPLVPDSDDSDALSAQHAEDKLLDIADVQGKRMISTILGRSVTIREGNAAAALEVMSRFAVDPRWLIYLPPTMSPSETSQREGLLEHPAEAFDYYRAQGAARVVCEEKHMGSRAVVIVCKDAAAARARFGVTEGAGGVVYTRTGRPFFYDGELETALLDRLRAAIDAAGFWQRFETSWFCFDAEIMPWSFKARSLLKGQYGAVGAAGRLGLSQCLEVMAAAQSRGVDVGDLRGRFQARQEGVALYSDAYRRYCWPVEGLAGLKLAPFHLLASEGACHSDKNHVWHMETLAELCRQDEALLLATPYRIVDLGDEESCAAAAAWWEGLTGEGGEGMVVKPESFILRGGKGPAQPAVKCRGREYLRIIYGPEYTNEEHLQRLRQRGLGLKRSLAMREFALGLTALDRFVKGEPLRRVHESVFGVLALESEPVDPRL